MQPCAHWSFKDFSLISSWFSVIRLQLNSVLSYFKVKIRIFAQIADDPFWRHWPGRPRPPYKLMPVEDWKEIYGLSNVASDSVAIRCVSGFVDDVTFAIIGAAQEGCLGLTRMWHHGVLSYWLTRGQHQTGTESDVYGGFVFSAVAVGAYRLSWL